MITRHQQGFTVVHPTPAFPSPVTPDGTGILGLYPELHTRLSRTQQRMSGRGRAWTLPGLRPWHQPASFDALTHHVRPHVAAINHHVAGAAPKSPADLGKAGCSWPRPPAATADHPAQKGHQPEPLNHNPHPPGLPAPRRLHDPLPDDRVKGACGAAARALRAPVTRPPARRNPAATGRQGPDSGMPGPTRGHDRKTPEIEPLRLPRMQVRRRRSVTPGYYLEAGFRSWGLTFLTVKYRFELSNGYSIACDVGD